MYRTSVDYYNRSGVAYKFVKTGSNTVAFDMSPDALAYCRIGGLDGQAFVDWENLGYIDPAGGPMIGLGTVIDDRKVVKVSVLDGATILELSNDNA